MAPIFTGRAFGFGRGAAGPTGPTGPFSASGGNVNGLAPGNGYIYHTFTSPGTFTVTNAPPTFNVECLVVAGGGFGAGGRGGGGGAGGLIYSPTFTIISGSYPVTIGNGGSEFVPSPSQPGRVVGESGGNSVFSTLTAIGGGGGATCCDGGGIGAPGGSGGGGGGFAAGQFKPGGSGTPGQGNPGGQASGNNVYGSGGGGGAGQVGQNGAPGGTGNGGNGLQYPQFTGPLIGVPALNPLSGYYAGGGGGGQPTATAAGGLGGGAGGATQAVTNSGGGGGGGAISPGNGAPGIVIIRYLA